MKKILLIVVLTILFCGCKQTVTDYENNNYVIASSYKIIGSHYCTDVEKFIIEGHEYFVFTSKIANPPTVIHSESCPCHNHKEMQNDTIIIYR